VSARQAGWNVVLQNAWQNQAISSRQQQRTSKIGAQPGNVSVETAELEEYLLTRCAQQLTPQLCAAYQATMPMACSQKIRRINVKHLDARRVKLLVQGNP
jgi:hypothetical protein